MDTIAADTRPAHPSDLRALVVFARLAPPVGWHVVRIPLVTALPFSPFGLGALFLGLVLPAPSNRQGSTEDVGNGERTTTR